MTGMKTIVLEDHMKKLRIVWFVMLLAMTFVTVTYADEGAVDCTTQCKDENPGPDKNTCLTNCYMAVAAAKKAAAESDTKPTKAPAPQPSVKPAEPAPTKDPNQAVCPEGYTAVAVNGNKVTCSKKETIREEVPVETSTADTAFSSDLFWIVTALCGSWIFTFFVLIFGLIASNKRDSEIADMRKAWSAQFRNLDTRSDNRVKNLSALCSSELEKLSIKIAEKPDLTTIDQFNKKRADLAELRQQLAEDPVQAEISALEEESERIRQNIESLSLQKKEFEIAVAVAVGKIVELVRYPVEDPGKFVLMAAEADDKEAIELVEKFQAYTTTLREAKATKQAAQTNLDQLISQEQPLLEELERNEIEKTSLEASTQSIQEEIDAKEREINAMMPEPSPPPMPS